MKKIPVGRSVQFKKLNEFEAKDKETRAAAAQNFEHACQQKKLEYSVHHNHKITIQDLKHETIYCDLPVIDSKETLTHIMKNCQHVLYATC